MSDRFAIRSHRVITPTGQRPACVVIQEGHIEQLLNVDATPACPLQDCGDALLLPGLVDSHVHINEPGRTDWEGFSTATRAAAAGGITTLIDMPLNCIPVTTSAPALASKLAALTGKLQVDCGFWGGATADNAAQFEALLQAGVFGSKSFTIDSGIDEFSAVEAEQLLPRMRLLAQYNLPCLVHAELERKPTGTTATSPQTANTRDIGRSYQRFLQSRPARWENDAVAMVIDCMHRLCDEGLDPAAHIVHLSSAQALNSIRSARQQGLRLTVETCPHYLTLHAEAIGDGNTLFKCCPPIRERANQDQLWQAIKDGDIDFIVSDHSPCTPQLKALESGDLGQAWGGIAALQFGLPLLWTEGQKQGLEITDITRLMSTRVADFLGLGTEKGRIAPGFSADLCLFDDHDSYRISTDMIAHRHKISPYIGHRVSGRVLKTWLRGELVYDQGVFPSPPRGQALLKVPDTPSSESRFPT
ncbi:MAG TPA: allantoinase AllB [Gammaproteobacteria bacterium]|nr:allantoinase AllB [Gammaproteobacteria bacterium]